MESKQDDGYTLLELIVVLVIIFILIAMILWFRT